MDLLCRSAAWHELVRDPTLRYSTRPRTTKLYAEWPPVGRSRRMVSAAPSTVSPDREPVAHHAIAIGGPEVSVADGDACAAATAELAHEVGSSVAVGVAQEDHPAAGAGTGAALGPAA